MSRHRLAFATVAFVVGALAALLIVFVEQTGRGSPGGAGQSPAPAASSAFSPFVPTPSPAASPSPALLPLKAHVGRFGRAPAPAMRTGPRDLPVPILMYHVIAAPPPGAAYPSLFVPPAQFAAEMRYLVAHSYTAVTLQQVVDFWGGRAELPSKPVVLSFDDGYRSDYSMAAPILQRLGWPGVLNLCINAVKPRGELPVPHVVALIRRGWEIDAHSLTHPNLTTLGDAELAHQVAGSRTAIRRLFHVPCRFFCYPFGAFDQRVIDAVRAAGFAGATTTLAGNATPGGLYTLHRVRINDALSMADFAQKLPARSRTSPPPTPTRTNGTSKRSSPP